MNYVSVGRTNYFKVKDLEAFRAWAEDWPGLTTAEKPDNMVALLGEESGFCDKQIDDANETVLELTTEIQAHLVPGEVAIFIETGHEGLRCMEGWAQAVTSTGFVAGIHLSDIYALAAKQLNLPIAEISRAEY